jgi:mono/diheme cytochrome c family protein
MGRKLIIAVGLAGVVGALGDSFITYSEYATQLYLDPHGVSCAKCHGLYGEGKVLERYAVLKKGKNGEVKVVWKEVKAPNIQYVPLSKLKKKLYNPGTYSYMPSYRILSDTEIYALYYYLNQIAPEKWKKLKARLFNPSQIGR